MSEWKMDYAGIDFVSPEVGIDQIVTVNWYNFPIYCKKCGKNIFTINKGNDNLQLHDPRVVPL